MKKPADAMDRTPALHGHTPSTLTPKPSCITPEFWYFYLFKLEVVA